MCTFGVLGLSCETPAEGGPGRGSRAGGPTPCPVEEMKKNLKNLSI